MAHANRSRIEYEPIVGDPGGQHAADVEPLIGAVPGSDNVIPTPRLDALGLAGDFAKREAKLVVGAEKGDARVCDEADIQHHRVPFEIGRQHPTADGQLSQPLRQLGRKRWQDDRSFPLELKRTRLASRNQLRSFHNAVVPASAQISNVHLAISRCKRIGLERHEQNGPREQLLARICDAMHRCVARSRRDLPPEFLQFCQSLFDLQRSQSSGQVEGLSGQSPGNAETTVVIPIVGRAIEAERAPEEVRIVVKPRTTTQHTRRA